MKPPRPEDIQKEFEAFIEKRFGDELQVFPVDAKKDSFESKTEGKNGTKKSSKSADTYRFDYKPKEVKAYLDKFVIGQEEAKKAISIAVCDHYNQVKLHRSRGQTSLKEDNYIKQNLLILGTTGVGKTYMVKQAAKLIGVPFVKADATRFSETGYMGANVDDLIRDLVNQASGDLEKAQYGIIYLDEVDKLANQSGHSGRDVSGRGVQLGLLKLMEETDVDLRAGNDPASQIQAFMELQRNGRVDKQVVNTKYILFIASGAFNGLEKIIEKRVNLNTIGFQSLNGKDLDEKNKFSSASTEDFIKFGLEPEFIGRLPVRVACHDLDSEVLYNILKTSEGSILKQYVQAFKAHGIDASFTDEAIREVASLASSEKTGARGLSTICETFLREFKFELPSSHIKKFSITKELILNPKAELEKLLAAEKREVLEETREELIFFQEDFEKIYDISLSFTEEASLFLEDKSEETKTDIRELVQNILGEYGYAFTLLKKQTKENQFLVTKNILLNPKGELEKLMSH